MNRRTQITQLGIIFCLTIIATQSQAVAQRVDNSRIRDASAKYRQAVVDFERQVQRTRGIVTSDEKIVDRFEDQTARIVTAAKNPRQLSRLVFEYQKTVPFQQRAEQAIFGRYHVTPQIYYQWDVVLYCQALLEQELSFYLRDPQNSTRAIRRASTDNVQLPSQSVRNYAPGSTLLPSK